MESPNMMANIRIGVVGLMVPFGVQWRTPESWPSWKTQTRLQYITERDSKFMSIALIGNTTDPNARKSITNVANVTPRIMYGNVWDKLERVSTSWADWPPTLTVAFAGAATWRISLTSDS